jgi:gluconate 5-dehydrogenase
MNTVLLDSKNGASAGDSNGTRLAGAQEQVHADPFRLDGEVALITGGGSGLGFAHARCMARAGAKVMLVGRREDVLREAAREIGDAAHCYVNDITDYDAAQPLIDRITSEVGAPTILVNNAGMHLKKGMLDTTVEEFQKVLSVHLLGAYALTRACIPGMLERGKGNILFTSSMNALVNIPLTVAYAAAKSAYSGMVRTLTAEFSPRGIRVNALVPGWIETPMLHKALDNDPERKMKIINRTPMGRFGEPDDIGNAAVFLCSDAGKYITGVILPVDGGAGAGF